ncbi:DDE family transposase [Palleronia aestuarii]|uniref:DDE family transposase n=1 Tax=Palleronia aestuarii TaxID=568105 RepID=A0A2W7NA17_9RHOB|nr:DDE family transposase [Palleronia aestuarii]
MSEPVPTRYRTLNWSAYDASLRERGSLTVWFDPSTPWHAVPSGKRGGQLVYGDAAIQACLTIEVLDGLPLRQTTGFVASLPKLADLDWPVPFVGRSFHWKTR